MLAYEGLECRVLVYVGWECRVLEYGVLVDSYDVLVVKGHISQLVEFHGVLEFLVFHDKEWEKLEFHMNLQTSIVKDLRYLSLPIRVVKYSCMSIFTTKQVFNHWFIFFYVK